MSAPPPRLVVGKPERRPPARGRRPPVRGLRPVSDLPRRAHLLLVVCGLALVGFAAWVTVRLLQLDGRTTAILLIALSYLGAVIVGIAVVTLVRIAYSLRALPYLLGRGVRWMVVGRRRR